MTGPLNLSPCPFCGWGKVKCNTLRRGAYSRNGDNYQVVCNKCHARGPLAQDDPNKAILGWNSLVHRAAEPAVEGDLLPPVGERVLIHLARSDKWVEHRVIGYYVWGDLRGDPGLQRVNVRVISEDGYQNARLLKDVRRLDGSPYVPSSAAR